CIKLNFEPLFMTGPITNIKENWVTTSTMNQIYLWDFKNGKLLNKYLIPQGNISCTRFDSSKIIVSSTNCLKLIDINSKKVLNLQTDHTKSITCMQYNQKYCVTGSKDKFVKLWDVRSGKCIKSLQ